MEDIYNELATVTLALMDLSALHGGYKHVIRDASDLLSDAGHPDFNSVVKLLAQVKELRHLNLDHPLIKTMDLLALQNILLEQCP